MDYKGAAEDTCSREPTPNEAGTEVSNDNEAATPAEASDSCCYDESLMSKHLDRQSYVLSKILSENKDPVPESLADLGAKLESSLFTPSQRPQNQDPDPRLNFFPPFLTPECLALHYPFFMNLPIPRSCKANRTQSKILDEMLRVQTPVTYLPDPTKVQWNDDIGKASLMFDLKENQKFALLKDDSVRLQWFKTKALNMKTFAYPCVALPPAVQRMLVEVFIGKSQMPNALEKYEVAVDDTLLASIWGKSKLKEAREAISIAVTQYVLLRCMQRFFSDRQTIINIQESLHYMFGHGFVRMIKILTDTDLSEFVTYHGLTHRNRLNNCRLQEQLEDGDRRDYILDTIYLFLVFTWQTAMDIWQQTLDEATITRLGELLLRQRNKILRNKSVFKMSNAICDIVYPEVVHKTFTTNLPDFVSQAQINNFRLFILSKSGVPQCVVPMMPSDVVPCAFEEAHPVLWSHVMLLRSASFLKNHGCYERPSNELTDGISDVLCECNLCSPHRMPAYNTPLLQEITSINKINLQQLDSKGHEKQFSLTPQSFANNYIKKVPQKDFFHDKVCLYKDEPEQFTEPMEACVIKSAKLLALFKESEIRREQELLKRGRGVYLDPQTGEELNAKASKAIARDIKRGIEHDGSGENLQTDNERQRSRDAVATAPTAPPRRHRRMSDAL